MELCVKMCGDGSGNTCLTPGVALGSLRVGKVQAFGWKSTGKASGTQHPEDF